MYTEQSYTRIYNMYIYICIIYYAHIHIILHSGAPPSVDFSIGPLPWRSVLRGALVTIRMVAMLSGVSCALVPEVYDALMLRDAISVQKAKLEKNGKKRELQASTCQFH